MANLDPWYVTGFCDGEAAFTYSRARGSFNIYFGIKQREDNQQIIDDLWEYFGYAGAVYRNKESASTKNSGFTNASAYFRVSRIDELAVIISHFDKYPLQSQKKSEAYKIWREMVIHKLENYRNADYDKLRMLAERLSRANLKSRAFKVHSK
ncbi:MAG: LAGLIDADG family homing endonuclease [Candidatus Omnitrophica bacterium]|nr:LAGLIDADG family homing endonuclease [Candidatus Omnitrophota bacterium]